MSQLDGEGEDSSEGFRHVEFKFPLLLIKTRRGRNLMDRLAGNRLTPALGNFYLYIMPVIAAAMIYLALFAIFRYLTTPALSQFVRSLGPQANLLLPGLNPYLPIVYGWIALLTAMIVHEASHGIMARRQGFMVKDSGLIFLLFIPIGAFVELDEEELKRASPGTAGRILAAGAGSNFVVAAVSLLLMLLVVSTYIPVSAPSGIAVVTVEPNSPTYLAGLRAGDILVALNSTTLNTTAQLSQFMASTHPGEVLTITYQHAGVMESSQLVLASNPNNRSIGYLGITPAENPSLVLKSFLAFSPLSISRYFVFPSLVASQVPFSQQMQMFYTSSLGVLAFPLTNLLFWMWFVNLNLALFNALPLGPFDGGVAFRHLLRAITHADWDSKIVRNTSNVVSVLMLFIVFALLTIPYLI
ncbi:MAG: site-2 protease family protein [Conexivisphaerales archaeon]